MSKDSSFTDTSLLEEDTPQSQSLRKAHLTSSDTDISHSGIQPKRRTRADFEYIYKNIDNLECQTWASDLESWLNFIGKHNIFQDPSLPILDKNGLEYPDLTFLLDTLLQLPSNKKYLEGRQRKQNLMISRHHLQDITLATKICLTLLELILALLLALQVLLWCYIIKIY